MVDLAIVPRSVWWDGIRGFLTPAAPPAGITATLGALAGLTALASGLNWSMADYRDKGYGMGHRVGFIAGLCGERRELSRSATFRDTPETVPGGGAGTGRCDSTSGGVLLRRNARDAAANDPMAMSSRPAGKADDEERADVRAEKLVTSTVGMFYLMLVVGVLILFSTHWAS